MIMSRAALLNRVHHQCGTVCYLRSACSAAHAMHKITVQRSMLTETESLRKGSPAAPSGTGNGLAQEPGPVDGGGGSGMGWPGGVERWQRMQTVTILTE